MRLALLLTLSAALPLATLGAVQAAAQTEAEVTAKPKTDVEAARAATARANARAAKAKAAAAAPSTPEAAPSPAAAADAPTATAADAPAAEVPSAAAAEPAASAGGAELAAGAINAGAAPTDDFGFVSWCAGAVEGYMRLKPAVLPDVRRIEARFREPGRTLADDMKVYDDLEKEGRRQRALYGRAIQAAEKASPRDISDEGFTAYKRGLAVWAAPAGSSKARIAQEWMGWALPEKCETTAKALVQKSALFGQALKPSTNADSPAATGTPDAPETASDAGLKGPK